MPERALLIWNPAAGRRPQRQRHQVEQIAAELRRGGWQVDAAATETDGGARLAAERGIREGYSVLLACGGDGTLGQIADVLAASAGELPILAAVPFGTANVFAHAAGCPHRPDAAARWLLRARMRLMPLGQAESAAGTRHFLSVASVGLDAAVVHRMRSADKRRWGKLAYVRGALMTWRGYFPAPLEYEINAQARMADGIIVGLTRFYGGRLRLGQVEPSGGIALALRGAPRGLACQALCLATIGLERAPGVERLPSGTIRITTPGLPLELDGEPAGHTPATLRIIEAAIPMLMADD